MPVYISIETNRKYLLLWCPERRTGVLPSILETLQEVQGGIKSKNGRLSSMNNFWQQTLQAFPPNVSVEVEALSMLAYSNEDLASDQQEGAITDFKPLTQANDLPIRFLNPKMEQAHPPPRAPRVSHGRGERETGVTGDEPQGIMGRVQTAREARLARCLLPTFLCAHIFIEREKERDVWVRGRSGPIIIRQKGKMCHK